jgi:hypothetical protein
MNHVRKAVLFGVLFQHGFLIGNALLKQSLKNYEKTAKTLGFTAI